MPMIKFLPMGKEIRVLEGTTVLQAEQEAGIHQDAPCGGNGQCGKCKVLVNGRECLACRTIVREDITVTVGEEPYGAEILSEGISRKVTVQPVQEGSFHVGVDIGTTTVVAYLLDGTTGEILDTRSMLNPQFPYGADVISRIQAAMSGKLEELCNLIREGVWLLILELCKGQGRSPKEIGTVAVVGNPAMQQLFMGISEENLAKPPFLPFFTKTEVVSLAKCFPVESKGKLLVIPDIAGYVGADTLGCVLSTGMYLDSRMTLMVDIGTNGEMVLGNCDRMAACSTAAGPALEGGQISCGMRGSEGAIDHLWMEEDRICYSVIGAPKAVGLCGSGDIKATGLCGSGIIDAVAVMLELGIINKRGRIQKDYRSCGKDRIYDLTDRVSITQDDIREVQMAKGAIAAGIALMAEHLHVKIEEIDRLILCGAFGNYMKPESACKIGLLPMELLDKIESGGNGAGMGSRQMALDQEMFYLTDRLLERIEPLELAAFPEFQRVYAANMMFPVG